MDYLDSIQRESDAFYAAAAGADPTLGVPSCPGWDIADLVWHLGEVHWFWATDIELRASDPEAIEKGKPQRPADYHELIAWGRSQLERMLSVLTATPDDVTVWTWALEEKDHTVGFIRRHQVQEAAVHRWDMQNAATQAAPDPVDPAVAADSIDELFSFTLPWGVNKKKPLTGSVHVHCTDTEGEWFIHPDGRVERVHAKGDVAVRGTASDLLLVLFTRVGIDTLELIGNESLARKLVEAINTE
ncbi:MAG: hypothetical protein QOI95_4131 [Acidimicrobiaceae bacterium]|jgi:uncharacterized protein (TIGR03083 family)